MTSANINDIKKALDYINEDVRRLAIAKEDFRLTWDTLVSEMISLQLYKELEEFWYDMMIEIKEKAPAIHQQYLSEVNLITVIALAHLSIQGYGATDYLQEEAERIQKALSSEEYDATNYVKILFGCAMHILLTEFTWKVILDQAKKSLWKNAGDKQATQYFACECFIPFADFLINGIEEYRDGYYSNIADAWASSSC